VSESGEGDVGDSRGSSADGETIVLRGRPVGGGYAEAFAHARSMRHPGLPALEPTRVSDFVKKVENRDDALQFPLQIGHHIFVANKEITVAAHTLLIFDSLAHRLTQGKGKSADRGDRTLVLNGPHLVRSKNVSRVTNHVNEARVVSPSH
jgi:hypothetical protein